MAGDRTAIISGGEGRNTLAALRAGLADRYAVATANASVNAIRGALRAAWLSGDMDRAMLERSLAALRQVRGNAAPGRALSPVEARELFEAAGTGLPARCRPRGTPLRCVRPRLTS